MTKQKGEKRKNLRTKRLLSGITNPPRKKKRKNVPDLTLERKTSIQIPTEK